MKKKCSMLPINDVWIAGHALEQGAVLVSYDKHFFKSGASHILTS